MVEKLFISYSNADGGPWAEWIAWQLEDEGDFQCVLQRWDFPPGVDFLRVMTSELRAVNRLLLVVTPGLAEAKFAEAEWQVQFLRDPLAKEGRIVPILTTANAEPPSLLGSRVHIDLSGLDEVAARQTLLQGMQRGRRKPANPPEFPGEHTGSSRARPPFPRATRAPACAPLHLLHFGGVGLLSDSDRTQALNDVRKSLGTLGVPEVDLVVWTGGITRSGKRSQFETALQFLQRLGELIKVGPENTIVVPGPSDVNLDLSLSYVSECRGREEEPQLPHWPKWEPLLEFLRNLYGEDRVLDPNGGFTLEHPWFLFELEARRAAIAGLNCTVSVTHDCTTAELGDAQVDWFLERLVGYRQRGWLRLGAIAESPLSGPSNNEQALADASRMADILHPQLNLLLHGQGFEEPLASPSSGLLTLGAGARSRPENPSAGDFAYNLVTLGRSGLHIRRRRYAAGTWTAGESLDVRPHETPGGGSLLIDTRAVFPPATGTAESPVDGQEDAAEASQGTVIHRPLVGQVRVPSEAREVHVVGDEFIDRVADLLRVRDPDSKVDLVRADAHLPYLRVLTPVPQAPGIHRYYAVGTFETGLDRTRLDDFTNTVHRRYRAAEPGATSQIVYGGEPPEAELEQLAARSGIRLVSFTELQGLIDFRPYVRRQQRELQADGRYPAGLYVPQRYREFPTLQFSLQQRSSAWQDIREDLASRALQWLAEPFGRLLLVLGDFGRGKTFLMREIARRLSTDAADLGQVPVLIELHALEKSHDLDQLVATHLLKYGEERFDRRRFRYMLREGRVALLFDGFDELAGRVTFARAADHLDTILEAAEGNAKIVVTSRVQHFLSDRDVTTRLGQRVDLAHGRRLVRLEDFNDSQIRDYLTKQFGDAARAERYLSLLRDLTDLLGLAHNPRMLEFITSLSEDRLRQAQEEHGSVTPAVLYEELLRWWLDRESDRLDRVLGHGHGVSAGLLSNAVTHLAVRLWSSSEATLDEAALLAVGHSLAEEISTSARKPAATSTVTGAMKLDAEQGAQLLGSATLLTRSSDARFRFTHQSLMEWLVARRVASGLLGTPQDTTLLCRNILSEIMLDFLGQMKVAELLQAWAEQVLISPPEGREASINALRITDAWGARRRLGDRVDLAGEDLRGVDLSARLDLKGAHMQGVDLESAILTGLDLTGADLRDSSLRLARLEGANLSGADLRGVDATGARLQGANLLGCRLDGSTWRGAALIGAKVDPAALQSADTQGAALPDSDRADLVLATAAVDFALAFSSDARLLASGGSDRTLRVWDTVSGQLQRVLVGHTDWVRGVAWSPDGQLLASASEDGTARIWVAATGECRRILQGHRDWVWAVGWSATGEQLVTASEDGSIRLWELATGEEVARVRPSGSAVRSASWSSQGTVVVAGCEDGAVYLWAPGSQDPPTTIARHSSPVRAISWAPHGGSLVTGDAAGQVEVRDGDSRVLPLEGHKGTVWCAAWSADGTAIATAGEDRTVRIWDAESGQQTRLLDGHADVVRAVAWSPDCDLVASSSYDGTIRLSSVASSTRPVRVLGASVGGIWSVAWSPDGRQLASGGADKAVRVWDLATGRVRRELGRHSSGVWAVAWSPDGDRVASGGADYSVTLWRPGAGDAQRLEGHTDWVRALAWSPEGELVASSSADSLVRIWRASTGESVQLLRGHRDQVRAVQWSQDGATIATGSDDGTVRLWDAATGEAIRVIEGHYKRVWAVSWSPLGQLLAAGGEDHMLRIWNTADGTLAHVLDGHASWIGSIAWSPDGSTIASGGADRTVRLWSASSGTRVGTLVGHSDWVWSVNWSPDGSHLATAGEDRTVRLWDASSREQVCAMLPLMEGGSAVLFPDGRYKLDGPVTGEFWYNINLCRFEPGELDGLVGGIQRVAPDTPLLGLASPRSSQ